jgi:tetratricopeptide (TPR) repeat protein
MSDTNRSDWLVRARELRQRGESARRHDGATAQSCYVEAVLLLRKADEPLVLAHAIRHLGDVYVEQGLLELAEPCYHEALELYRGQGDQSSLDLANAIRSLAMLRWEQSRALWSEVRHRYINLKIDAGVKESSDRLTALAMR